MGSSLAQYAPEWIWMGPYCKRMMERMCLEPPGRIWEVLVGSRRKRKVPRNKNGKPIKIQRCLMGSILGPYAPEWIWMCPYFKRVMVRMCSDPPGRIWEVLVGF